MCASLSSEACAILQAFCCSRQHQQDRHFSPFSLSLSLLRFPPRRLSFYRTLPGISGRNYPFSPPTLLLGYNGFLVTHFFHIMTRPMSWSSGANCSTHQLSLVVSLSSYFSCNFSLCDCRLSLMT